MKNTILSFTIGFFTCAYLIFNCPSIAENLTQFGLKLAGAQQNYAFEAAAVPHYATFDLPQKKNKK